MNAARSRAAKRHDRQVLLVVGIVAVQAVAAVFFVADALGDMASGVVSPHIVIEALIAAALLGGVVLGALHTRSLLGEARRRDAALAIAAGALAEHIAIRFRDWRPTPAEAEVALFALKGCDAAEIARLRAAAAGTVRAQLSHVYAKAGVTSHAGLVSLFIEDLLDAG